jgi:hypothetical protein
MNALISRGPPSLREDALELIGELVDFRMYICVASQPNIRMTLEPLTYLKISLHDERGKKENITAYINSVAHSDKRQRDEDQNLVIDTLSPKWRWHVS